MTAASPVSTPARAGGPAAPTSWPSAATAGDELERGPHRPLGVVLLRDRRAPDGHHGVADELLDRAAVALDHRPRAVEVAREQLAHLLRVARLRQRREADQVGEQHRDQAALGDRGVASRCRLCHDGGRLQERRAALAAEALSGLVDGPTRVAGSGECRSALGAELPAFAVRSAAAWTDRHIRGA